MDEVRILLVNQMQAFLEFKSKDIHEAAADKISGISLWGNLEKQTLNSSF
jgi:hypothetical protein